VNIAPSTNPERVRQYRLLTRYEVVQRYGGKCVCCGESRFEFLTIDHKYGGGCKHRKELKVTSITFFLWLLRNNCPTDDYQLLCYNCNCAKLDDQVCPHKLPPFIPERQIKRQTGKYAMRQGKCALCGATFTRRKFRRNPEYTTCANLRCRNTMVARLRWGLPINGKEKNDSGKV